MEKVSTPSSYWTKFKPLILKPLTCAEFCLDVLLPPRCELCLQLLDIGLFHARDLPPDEKVLCKSCNLTARERLQREEQTITPLPTSKLRYQTASWLMAPRSRQIIHAFKYRSGYRLTSYLVSEMLSAALNHPAADWDLIVVVPSSDKSMRERGFMHTRALASKIAKSLNLPIASVRTLTFKPSSKVVRQAWLSRKARTSSESRKTLCSSRFSGEGILLIDDVITTGRTAESCAVALKQQGAGVIDLLTLIRCC